MMLKIWFLLLQSSVTLSVLSVLGSKQGLGYNCPGDDIRVTFYNIFSNGKLSL
jgi:hypothetical protein